MIEEIKAQDATPGTDAPAAAPTDAPAADGAAPAGDAPTETPAA